MRKRIVTTSTHKGAINLKSARIATRSLRKQKLVDNRRTVERFRRSTPSPMRQAQAAKTAEAKHKAASF